MRRLMFRTVSQTGVNYRGSSLSEGRAGAVRGGDRLPWVQTNLNGVESDNFAPLNSMDWQAHVYGDAAPELGQCAMCENYRCTFFRGSGDEKPGLRRYAPYLVRPDGYIALANADTSASALPSYLDRYKLKWQRHARGYSTLRITFLTAF